MPTGVVRPCQCAGCMAGIDHRDREYHRQMNLLLSRLDEQQRRWYLAVESQRPGHGADRLLFEITGVDEKTIRRGRGELAASLAEQLPRLPALQPRRGLGWSLPGVRHTRAADRSARRGGGWHSLKLSTAARELGVDMPLCSRRAWITAARLPSPPELRRWAPLAVSRIH